MLLTHDNAYAAPPTFGKSDANNLQFWRQIPQQLVGRGMKAQCRGDQINQRRRRLEWNSRKISVARKIIELQVMLHVPPITGSLQSEVNMLRCFQFQNSQTATARNA